MKTFEFEIEERLKIQVDAETEFIARNKMNTLIARGEIAFRHPRFLTVVGEEVAQIETISDADEEEQGDW